MFPLSNAQAGKAEGKRLSLIRHAPEGLRKVQTANDTGGDRRESIGHNS